MKKLIIFLILVFFSCDTNNGISTKETGFHIVEYHVSGDNFNYKFRNPNANELYNPPQRTQTFTNVYDGKLCEIQVSFNNSGTYWSARVFITVDGDSKIQKDVWEYRDGQQFYSFKYITR